jgi:hypothetical protein
MTRRRFAFWIGMGLFGIAERLRAESLDKVAASLMKATETPAAPPAPTEALEAAATADMPVHWQMTHNNTWRWVEREHYIDGEWRVSGMTTPVRRDTGEPLEDPVEGYLPDDEVPEEFLQAYDEITDANGDPALPEGDDGIAATEDAPGPDAAEYRRARHGRPPSRWLRTLNAPELSVWLATITPPEAGVSGMTFTEHLTRDHEFDETRIAGLSDAELEKLHAAAHHGY